MNNKIINFDKNTSVLIVDDTPSNLEIIENYLQESGLSTFIATSGEIAIKRAEYLQPNLILLDIMMPGLNGFETCKILKSSEKTKNIPIIFMTALTDIENKKKGFEVGAVDYITKPIEKHELFARVTTHLKIYQYQKMLENEVIKKSRELTLTQEQFSSLVNNVPGITYRCKNDKDWTMIYMNDATEKITGYKSSEFINNKIRTYKSIIDPNDFDSVKQTITKSIKNNEQWQVRYKIINKEKKISWVFEQGIAIRNEQKEIIFFDGIILDITKYKNLEEQLTHHSKMKAIGQLTGGIAHDFNNMLSGIMGATQLLKSPKRNLDEKSLKYIELIDNATTQAANLISKLLTFGHKNKTEFTIIDIHTIIDDTISILSKTINQKISIINNKNAHNSIISGDSAAIQNSLMNLGINSSHAIKEKGSLIFETKNIYLDKNFCKKSPFNLKEGNFIVIKVKDTGQGIEKEILLKIFEPFFTTKEQGKGTGLGLSSVYASIENHHGAIEVNSKLNTGTEFIIYLPISSKHINNVETDNSKDNSEATGSGLIILIDDENIVRITVADLLTNMGYKVLVFKNPLDAIEKFKKIYKHVNLVITDMMMPTISGKEVFYILRKIDKDCKVIISSGFIKNIDLNDLKKDGLNGFIKKPFKDVELNTLLKKILNS